MHVGCLFLLEDNVLVPGAYILLEATDVEPGSEFELQSEDLSVSGRPAPYRVSFWYHSFGAHASKLTVSEWDGTVLSDPIWEAPPETNVGK